MEIVIFILVLVALIVVHEFGHFIAAKIAGMRVDEFGIGYPPRAFRFAKKGDTEYTMNWLPFGGFVKIYGEDSDAIATKTGRAFTDKNRFVQALVLVAGIVMNLAFAWLLITFTLATGTPRALTEEQANTVPDAVLMVASVLPGSPAAEAGLKPGDEIIGIEGAGGSFTGASATGFTAFVAEHEAGLPLTLTLRENDDSTRTVTTAAAQGIIASNPERSALGVAVAPVGTVRVAWYEAPLEALRLTANLTRDTALGLAGFFGSIFTLSADLGTVSGPVGIAGVVGDASQDGWGPLLTITAIISVNLALINLLPIPALDGGRLLFVIIESIIRRPIKPVIAQTVNGIGFFLLILLMLAVTASDIFKLIG